MGVNHPEDPAEQASVRRLDTVGVENVLGAMVEQRVRRASNPEMPRVVVEEHVAKHAAGEPAAEGDEAADGAFMKAR